MSWQVRSNFLNRLTLLGAQSSHPSHPNHKILPRKGHRALIMSLLHITTTISINASHSRTAMRKSATLSNFTWITWVACRPNIPIPNFQQPLLLRSLIRNVIKRLKTLGRSRCRSISECHPRPRWVLRSTHWSRPLECWRHPTKSGGLRLLLTMRAAQRPWTVAVNIQPLTTSSLRTWTSSRRIIKGSGRQRLCWRSLVPPNMPPSCVQATRKYTGSVSQMPDCGMTTHGHLSDCRICNTSLFRCRGRNATWRPWSRRTTST